ncbi:hypothetical protein IWW51_002464 [Coemansia sp. RSA 2702]|nr:hypothetical protein IWW52_003416 [Coemansia sp. RSA 2704]KAJ2326077.1 hypothetical protein IWW51_002464 [Coemansia sp. RSA 2702]
MAVFVWFISLMALAAIAHLSGSRGKQGLKQQLTDGACSVVLRSAQLAFAVHRSFQAWVQNSLTQAGLDMQELLQGDDTEAILAKRQQLSDLLASLPQRPEHLAVILPEHEVRENEAIGGLLASEVDDVEVLCAWGLLAKIRRLSIYARDDSLGRAFDSIAGRLRNSKMVARAFNGRTPDICLDSSGRVEHICANSGSTRPDIHISLWTRDHGYPSLVRLSRELSREVQSKALAPAAITEALVADRLQDPRGSKHPELVLLLDDLPCVSEFPPWPLQNSELVQADSGARSLGDAVFRALVCFAKIEMRFGK